jgi:predicted amidohydrolase YtcJ
MGVGNSFSSLDLRYAKSSTEMTTRIRHYARYLPADRWIVGGGWAGEWRLPDRDTLQAAAPFNPIMLYKAGGQEAIANATAFRVAGIKDEELDVDTKATGLVRGPLLRRLARAVPNDHTRRWSENAETATNYAASLGVTSVQDMHSDDSRAIYVELQRQGKLKTRVYDCVPLRDWQKLLSSRLKSKPGDMVIDGCLKSFADGDENSSASLERDIRAADAARLQIMIHAIGNSANRQILSIFERVAKANGKRDRRFRVEHAHNALIDDLPRFARGRFIASMQPFLFADSNGSRFGTLLKQRVHVAFGSDAAMVDLNPLLGIHAAVTSDEGAISVYEAVYAYTVGSAYAEFREREKGTIEVGKLADFVILSDDIFSVDRDKVRDSRVLWTVVDGKAVYKSN